MEMTSHAFKYSGEIGNSSSWIAIEDDNLNLTQNSKWFGGWVLGGYWVGTGCNLCKLRLRQGQVQEPEEVIRTNWSIDLGRRLTMTMTIEGFSPYSWLPSRVRQAFPYLQVQHILRYCWRWWWLGWLGWWLGWWGWWWWWNINLVFQFGDTQVVDRSPAVRDHNPSAQGRNLCQMNHDNGDNGTLPDESYFNLLLKIRLTCLLPRGLLALGNLAPADQDTLFQKLDLSTAVLLFSLWYPIYMR